MQQSAQRDKETGCLDLMYNKADAVVIGKDKVRFLKLAGNVEESDDEKEADSNAEMRA